MEQDAERRLHQRIDEVIREIKGVGNQVTTVETTCRMCREQVKSDIRQLERWVDGDNGEGLRGRIQQHDARLKAVEEVTETGKKLVWKILERVLPALVAGAIGAGGAGTVWALLK